MTVKQLLSTIDSRELSEWMAYAKFEPFGPLRADFRAGTIATVLASIHGKKGSRFEPKMFFPELGYVKQQKASTSSLKDQLLTITKTLGGRVLKKGEKRPSKPPKKERKPRGDNRGHPSKHRS